MTQTAKSLKVVNSGSGSEKQSSGGICPCEDLQCQVEGNPAQRLRGKVIRLWAGHAVKQQRRRWWAEVQGTGHAGPWVHVKGAEGSTVVLVLNVTAVPRVACSFQAASRKINILLLV